MSRVSEGGVDKVGCLICFLVVAVSAFAVFAEISRAVTWMKWAWS